MIEISNVSFAYKNQPVLRDVNFTLNDGLNLCILGENGSGKSTLLKCMLKILNFKGKICIDGINISKISHKNLAQIVAYIPQSHQLNFNYKVIDMVLMGRLAYKGIFEPFSKSDYMICEEVMETLDIAKFKERHFLGLSGGQRQLVYIARALSAKPKFVFMDEPVTGLDFANQIKLLKLIKNLSKNINFIIATHQPKHATYLDTEVLMLKNGVVFKNGHANIINSENLSALYEVDYDEFSNFI